MTICDSFRHLAFSTWAKLGEAAAQNYPLKEETVTDLNLLEICTRHSGDVKTNAFTRHEEGKNGADWEWWFTGKSGFWSRFRVQAKILSPLTNRFTHLHYHPPKKKRYQSNVLVSRSRTILPQAIPLYCLYLHYPPLAKARIWSCKSFGALPESYGCSLLPASSVIKFRKLHIDGISDMQGQLIPWHCLVCCRGYADADLPIRVLATWGNLAQDKTLLRDIAPFEPGDGVDGNLRKQSKFLTREVPHYVRQIQEQGARADAILPPDVSRVTIFSSTT